MFSLNQILGFSDQQYLLKELFDLFDVLYGDKGRIADQVIYN